MIAIFSWSWVVTEQVGQRLSAARAGVVRGVASLSRAIKNRRAATALAGLDDHMLADIGLTRSDLRDAYSEPLWHDPTDVLVGRAAERRHRRRSSLVRSQNEPQPNWLHRESVTCN
jgi:uncharacterized protein YjiS (DUF1127 family)